MSSGEEDDLPWARAVDDGWLLELRIQPGARRSEVVGLLGRSLKIKVAAPADDGRANAELIRFLAGTLGLTRRDVRIVRGASSRTKVVAVDATLDPAVLRAALIG